VPEYQPLFSSGDLTLQITNTGLPLTLGGFGVGPEELALIDSHVWRGKSDLEGPYVHTTGFTFVATPEPQTIALAVVPLIAIFSARKKIRPVHFQRKSAN
jgi:hypothetical protein